MPTGLWAPAAWLGVFLAACQSSDADSIDYTVTADAAPQDGAAGGAAVDAAVPAPDASGLGTQSGDRADAGASDAGSSANDAGTPQTARDAALVDAAVSDAAVHSDAAVDSDAAAINDLAAVAAGLHGLFLDVPCAPSTPTPLASGATCQHPSGTQHIEKPVTLGGQVGTLYSITLRVRGIWEPTLIQGGQRPATSDPFTIGGMSPPGTGDSDPINYQQYSLQVSEPKQTYWLNDHQRVGHEIYKEDYQATIRAAAGARVTVVMNDGNERQIANFTKAFFQGVPPYDTAPSLGQSLRLDVVTVTTAAP